MKRSLIGFVVAICICIVFPLLAQESPDQDGRYLIQFKAFHGAAAAVRAAGGTPVVELAPQNTVAAYLPDQAIQGLRNNPNVLLIEPDPRRYLMAQTVPYGIQMVQADQVSDSAAGNCTVCIIDSGYYRNHDDLQVANVTGTNDSGSGNWYEDTCGHGSHVAGTIAALNNALGVVGVLGSGAINLHIEKVFDGSDCAWSYSSNLIAALNRCRNNAGGRNLVVSMSLGGSFSSTTENTAFQSAYDAGVLSIAAAGNAGNKRKSYPASYASVISVAAVDSNKNIASFSQQNSEVELAAPGVGVLSTVPFASASISVGGESYLGENIDGSARTNASGALADGGLCGSAGAWSGKVVLCERGGDTFATKVANVKSGGGVAAVIYNNVSGGFAGTLNGSSTIPAISISQEDGQALLTNVGQSSTVTNTAGAGSGYAYYDGTSMATPHVSGVAALVWSNAPAKTNAEVRQALQATAEDRGSSGRDNAYGFGIVKAKAALTYLGGTPPPPGNNPPTANFTWSCTDLSCNFVDASGDSDGTIAARSWTFGDGTSSTETNPSHTFGSAATYDVSLTVTDDDGATGSVSNSVTVTAPGGGGISLSASGYKVKGVQHADLSWSGATSASIDLYRGGVKVTTTANDGAHTDNIGAKGSGTYLYKICEAGTSVCSNEVTVSF